MKNKGLIILFVIFCFMLILNIMTPMLNEDYDAAFVWPEDYINLETLPENARVISSWTDFYNNGKIYYFKQGGRLPGGIPGGLFSWLGKEYFNPLNAFMFVILVAEIYWLSHEGKISFHFSPQYLIWIFFSLWTFGNSLVDTCLWMSGSSNYLWMLVLVLGFLLPYVQDYFNPESFKYNDSNRFIIVMFVLGILAGWSHETTICWIILVLSYRVYLCYRNNELRLWKLSGFLGLCIGYALLIFAPGNYSRLQSQQNPGLVLIGHELFFPKMVEQTIILVFQLFLWYFIMAFFIRQQKKNESY